MVDDDAGDESGDQLVVFGKLEQMHVRFPGA